MKKAPAFALQPNSEPFKKYDQQPEVDEAQERRRDRVRAAFVWIFAGLFVAVVIFAGYANQFGDWAKVRNCWRFFCLHLLVLSALELASISRIRQTDLSALHCGGVLRKHHA